MKRNSAAGNIFYVPLHSPGHDSHVGTLNTEELLLCALGCSVLARARGTRVLLEIPSPRPVCVTWTLLLGSWIHPTVLLMSMFDLLLAYPELCLIPECLHAAACVSNKASPTDILQELFGLDILRESLGHLSLMYVHVHGGSF